MKKQVPTKNDIRKQLIEYVQGNSNFDAPADLGPETNLLGEGILDSLGIVEITSFMEETFGIEIAEEEVSASNYRTLDLLSQLCAQKLSPVQESQQWQETSRQT